ncbi:thioester domain-containing protein [Saccharothrix violaceirubra]|uniref:TQXA domain-containing protein/LPXTG-motif cell wall-anchored protein n=1 Tax=Saccharothrix violaceirubra TaxID=413306 RepID=A0A7W7TC32_9PSEU|nr:thioester domain-containing protein [Saccharothrix violaceirubra]MBB4969045.1 TQXA domain-containing protein/LPXTG-motif cell wall-anchored protein [Saccharothrix violaceirubra]
MAHRLTLKRVGAAVLGASLVLMSGALPALADPVKIVPHPPANEQGMGVHLVGKKDAVNTELIGVKVTSDGKSQTLKTYCVELPTPLEDTTPLHEVPWDQHPNPDTKFKQNAAKVNWVLTHGYPRLTVDEARTKFGLPDLKSSSLIAATQAAVWHYSDGAELTKPDATAEPADVDAHVVKVYDYLTGDDNTGEAEPKPTLDIKPDETVHGKAGERIGPFTVTTTAKQIVLKADLPAGVKLVDKDGKELPYVKAGDAAAKAAPADVTVTDVYIQVEAGTKAGEAEFTVEATATLSQGRLFVSEDRNKKTQSLIVVTPVDVDVRDTAKADWTEVVTTTTTAPSTTPAPTTTQAPSTTPAPTTTTTQAPTTGGQDDDLASTGASIFVPLLIGLGLLGAGAAALIIVRRRKSAA